jgi:hypothetical protein
MNFHSSDLVGTGDIRAECTLTEWTHIWAKLRQAADDARRLGLVEWAVWRKQKGTGDPGQGAIVVPADQFWRMRAELEALRAADQDEQLAYDRGYAAGLSAQDRAAGQVVVQS